jgi:uncharacterized protein YndB with AHSA1/START domain
MSWLRSLILLLLEEKSVRQTLYESRESPVGLRMRAPSISAPRINKEPATRTKGKIVKAKHTIKNSDTSPAPATHVRKHNLVFTRIFDAPIEQAWNAWTDASMVKKWWGPESFTCPVAKMDVREGGRSLVCMRAPKDFGGQDMYSTWTYTRIVPMREIEYLHHFADKDGNRVDPQVQGLPPDMPSEVRNLVTFKAAGDNKTEITVTEFDWPAGQMMEMSKMGMEQCLDKMAASLAGSR